jgi:uncharacterized lipoprotein YmbA
MLWGAERRRTVKVLLVVVWVMLAGCSTTLPQARYYRAHVVFRPAKDGMVQVLVDAEETAEEPGDWLFSKEGRK